MSNNSDQFEIEIILSYLNSNSKKIFNEIILAKKNNMWATIIVFSLTIFSNLLIEKFMSFTLSISNHLFIKNKYDLF